MSVFFDEGQDPTPEPTEDSAPTGKSGRRARRVGLIILASALVLVLVVAGGVALYAHHLEQAINSNVHRSRLLPPGDDDTGGSGSDGGSSSTSGSDSAQSGKALNYVIMGSDSRDPSDAGDGRSDVLMVAHLAGDRKSAELISFPRDMYVAIPGHGKNKINAAYAYGGPQLTVRTLQQLLGIKIQHVALIDFDGFVQLTEDVGGVTIDNPHYSDEGGHVFPVGKITISGQDALAYVRERHQLPRGDLDRAERQRLVAQAILAKAMSPRMLSDPIAFSRFLSHAANDVTVDESLDLPEIRSTALSLRFTPADVKSLQAPISGFDTVRGMSIDVVDTAQLKDLGHALRTDTMSTYLEKYPNG